MNGALRHLSWRVRRRWYALVGYRGYIARHSNPAPAASKASGRGRMCFVDVTVIARRDVGTGIQRVVRSVLLELRRLESFCPTAMVFVSYDGDGYVVVELSAEGELVRTGRRCRFAAGDIFLGLDFSLEEIWRAREHLAELRRSGVRFWFVVYDILPLSHPQWFSRLTALRFRNWLTVIGVLAEGFFCISADVAGKLERGLADRLGIGGAHQLRVLPMGWDLSASARSLGAAAGFDALLATLEGQPAILMVGTIEPRKGHGDVLEAMELLWARGCDCQLVLVGAPGWRTGKLQQALSSHPEAGRRLHWLRQVGDEALARLYQVCSGLVMASHAEGFGLPLVEAIGHGRPVLARDLPVFRPHEDKGVTYFGASADAAELADAIAAWLAGCNPTLPNYADALPTWRDTAEFIATQLLGYQADAAADDKVGMDGVGLARLRG